MINNNRIEALKLYKNDLDKLIQREAKKIERSKEKQQEKGEQILLEYKNVNDVLEAYGCRSITENKKDKLMEFFENKDKVIKEHTPEGIYLNMLKQDINNIDIEIKHKDKLNDIPEGDIGIKEEPGIHLSDIYKIDTYDSLNLVVKKKITPKATDEKPNPEPVWKVISYHPNLESAFKSIVDDEVILSASSGIDKIMKTLQELKDFKHEIL